MNILVINVNAYLSSTGRIVQNLYNYLKDDGHDVKVCYRGTLEKRIDNVDFIAISKKWYFYLAVFFSRLTGLESHFNYVETRKVYKLIRKFKPDIVQLYNLHGNYINSYRLLNYLKKHKMNVVYSMVDEFPYMGKCPFPIDCERFKTECCQCPQKKVYPTSWFFDTSKYLFHKKGNIYNCFERLVFTGPPFVCLHAKDSYLLRNKRIIKLDEPFNFQECYYPRDTSKLRAMLGINVDERVVVCASGTQPRKGGKMFIAVANALSHIKDLKFIFIGYDRNDWDIPDNVISKGFISDQQELADYMSLADAYICTSVGDTTPSVCLGALGCGTPLIGFDYGGVVDCAPNEFGTYVSTGDVDALALAVSSVHKKTKEEIIKIRDYAVSRFSTEVVFSKQVKLYKSIINE